MIRLGKSEGNETNGTSFSPSLSLSAPLCFVMGGVEEEEEEEETKEGEAEEEEAEEVRPR